MNSYLYYGPVEHQRYKPIPHLFIYDVGYFFIDLDKVDETFNIPFLFSTGPVSVLSFRRKNYLGDKTKPLKECVQQLIFSKTGETHKGPIKLLTNISYFGFCFNPVSFYYCYNESGTGLQYIVAEVTNTPWSERHQHVLRFEGQKKNTYTLKKDFHVSPFMPMEIDYTWVFNSPDKDLYVLMQNRFAGEKDLMFDASLKLTRKTLNLKNVLTLILKSPLVSFKPTLLIYWQAVRLWIKKVPFYTHPGKIHKTEEKP